MHVTQPTVTNAIKELEAEFNVKLLERSNKEVLLTQTGKDFLEMSVQLLDYAAYMKAIMLEKTEENHRLLLGIPNMTNASCFTEFFGVFHKQYPDIEVQSTHDVTVNLMRLLDAGKLNLLLVPYKPTDAKYCHLVWKQTRFLFCVSKEHPLAGQRQVSIRQICKEPIVSYFGDSYLANFNLAEKYRANGHELKTVYRCTQINTMQEMIRKNEGCGFLIEGTFLEGSGIVGIPMDEPLPVTVYLVWTKESVRFSVAQKVLRCVRTYLGDASRHGPVL